MPSGMPLPSCHGVSAQHFSSKYHKKKFCMHRNLSVAPLSISMGQSFASSAHYMP